MVFIFLAYFSLYNGIQFFIRAIVGTSYTHMRV